MAPRIFIQRRRRRLVRQGLQLVDQVACQLAPTARHHLRDELASIGRAALPRILAGYEPSKTAFVPYARQRLRWTMIDGIRRDRRRQAPNRVSVDDCVANSEGRPLARAEAVRDPALIDDDDPEAHLSRRQLLDALTDELGALPETQRRLLRRHYFRGDSLDKLATELGVSRSTASRMHRRALRHLRSSLAARGLDSAQVFSRPW